MQPQPNTLSPSQLWIALESGAFPPNSLFRDQDDNIFIFTGKSLQVHESDEEDDVYVGLCVGDKLEFIGLFIEDKKVFRWEYEENRGKDWRRKIYKIFNGNELIVELINPTPDKLRSEFSYYGIEVDVQWKLKSTHPHTMINITIPTK